MKLRYSLLALAAVMAAGSASASLLYSTGFEPPAFTAGGSVNGIEGWENGSTAGATHSISDAVSNGGSQSMMWDNTGTNTSFYSVRRAFDPFDEGLTQSVVASVDMLITGNTQQNRLYGLYMGGTATSTLGGTNFGVSVSGSGIVRAGTSWNDTYSGPGLFDLNTTGGFADRWLRLELAKDLQTNLGTVSIFGPGGNLLWSESFANVQGIGNVNIGSDWFSGTERNGMAYFDNFALSAEPIPEPMTLGALALGAGLLAARRRRKA